MSERRDIWQSFALVASITMSAAFTACASVPATAPIAPAPQPVMIAPKPAPTPAPVREVRASWYGPGFAGRRTSSGERFNPNKLTAASKTIPLGSMVHVTNVENGRSVDVRINDCGPFVRGREIDLSHRAAQKLGMTRKGIARVRLDHVSTPPDAESPCKFVRSGD